MALSTQPYKGTRDFYPDEMRLRRWMFGRLRETVESFGYQEYDGPMLEPFELYAAKTGEEIVNQQLYWMMDRGDRKLAVRPEMTPTLARMVAGKLQDLPRPIRWYSIPNLWRYERPQKGRLREHWQLNVDVLGGDTVLADAEVITVALSLMRAFGAQTKISVRVNNRRLMDYFYAKLGLSAEAAVKVTKAMDARAKIGEEGYAKWLGEIGVSEEQRAEIEEFGKLSLDQVKSRYACDGAEEIGKLFARLKESGHEEGVVFDSSVLRGMDYYTGNVFEIYDVSGENRRAMFGGGRYDNLIGLFGNQKLSGVGFGMGDVTLRDFLETHALLPKSEGNIDVFVSLPKPEFFVAAEQIAQDLRAAGLKVMTPLEVGGFGAQLKQATRHQAKVVVLFGDAEWAEKKVLVKHLSSARQITVSLDDLLRSIHELTH